MSSARLEVITDDATIAPRMSRALPAALYGIVDAAAYQSFCVKLDELFELLYAEQRRRKKRFWWMYGAIYMWVLYFIIFTPIFFTSYDDGDSTASGWVPLCLCVIHICTVLVFTARPAGVKTDAETIRDIRLECEEMTNNTPFVSFHLVLMPVRMGARCAWLEINTVDHITVSISASASATSSATVVSAVMADAHDGKVTDNQESVVYAKAASNGNYQHGSGNELV
jgi:hypothetical protein